MIQIKLITIPPTKVLSIFCRLWLYNQLEIIIIYVNELYNLISFLNLYTLFIPLTLELTY
jgi:hypothetical protein